MYWSVHKQHKNSKKVRCTVDRWFSIALASSELPCPVTSKDIRKKEKLLLLPAKSYESLLFRTQKLQIKTKLIMTSNLHVSSQSNDS